MLTACVDAGQTKSSVTVYDPAGRAVHTWVLEPVIHYARAGGLKSYGDLAANVRERIRGLASRDPVAVCFSLTGYHGDAEAIPETIRNVFADPGFELADLRIVPDYWGNWYSVTKGEPGIVVISGGGTVAYGRDRNGRAVRLGGWGHQLGDEGSGYWIGLEALKAALKSNAGIKARTGMARGVLEALQAGGERELLAAYHSGAITDKHLALLVPIVNEWAEKGDAEAVRILDEGAGHLFDLSMAISEQLGGGLPIYLSGGVFHASALMERLMRRFREAGAERMVRKSSVDPAEGIYLLTTHGFR